MHSRGAKTPYIIEAPLLGVALRTSPAVFVISNEQQYLSRHQVPAPDREPLQPSERCRIRSLNQPTPLDSEDSTRIPSQRSIAYLVACNSIVSRTTCLTRLLRANAPHRFALEPSQSCPTSRSSRSARKMSVSILRKIRTMRYDIDYRAHSSNFRKHCNIERHTRRIYYCTRTLTLTTRCRKRYPQ